MAKKEAGVVDLERMEQKVVRVYVVGESPLILNRLAEKARRQLLLPTGRKNAAEKAQTLKHYPLEEYQASPYRLTNPEEPTLLAMPATAFKGALRNVALEMPGVNKAQIGRLTYIKGEFVGIFGVPQLFMSVVRSADMNKTPDIRTRAIVPRWAATFEIAYISPTLTITSVMNMMENAGMIIGVGDWRPEKGSGAFGRFRLVNEDDAEYQAITEHGRRQRQLAALENPDFYDEETAELYQWAVAETERRGRDKAQPVQRKKFVEVVA